MKIDLYEMKRDLYDIKRDLYEMKRDLYDMKRGEAQRCCVLLFPEFWCSHCSVSYRSLFM